MEERKSVPTVGGSFGGLFRGGLIAQVDGFVTPRHFPAFGLPYVLEDRP